MSEIDANTLTDEQVDKFFESEGENVPEGFEDTDEGDNIHEGDKDISDSKDESPSPPSDDDKQSHSDDVVINALTQERDNYKKAMDSERIQRKEMQNELARLQAVEEEIKKLNENFSKEKNKDSEIDFEENPLEALKKQQEKLFEKHAEYDSRIKSQEEYKELQSKYKVFENEVHTKTKEFSDKNPDYDEAYNHLVESRASELRIQGYSEEQIKNSIAQDELNIALKATKEGKNPAEIVYNLSKNRGYISKTEVKLNASSEKIDRIEKGISSSKSLGGTGGGASVDLSLESFSNMSEAEKNRILDDEDSWKKLVGGN